MTEIESLRFREIYRALSSRFDSGRLLLLGLGDGYLFFTSDKLHKAYGKAGSGQWGDIPDRFFFALNYQSVVKNGESKGSLDIELFDYGYKEERDAFIARALGLAGIELLDERKGYNCLYRHRLFGGKEKKSEQAENTERILLSLNDFLDEVLPSLEAVI